MTRLRQTDKRVYDMFMIFKHGMFITVWHEQADMRVHDVFVYKN